MSRPAPRFDAILVADWSAAARPARGADSIWIAVLDRAEGLTLDNPSTRAEAEALLAARLSELRARGRGTLAGFDFPFGHPRGTAARLFDAPGWRALWAGLRREVSEGPDNANDRFEAADRLAWRGAPFWGHPPGRRYAALRPTKGPFADLPEWREAEAFLRARGAQPKSVWQLSGAGAVEGQALTGIPALARLREALPEAALWPFETGFAPPEAPLVLAEVYPSLLPPHPGESVKDAGQVRALAEALAALDARGALDPLFAPPPDAPPEALRAAQAEEGWILGAGFEARLKTAVALRRPGGAPDPARLEARALAALRAETRLDRFDPPMASLATALVQACGDPSVADRLAWSPGAAEAGRAALAAGAPVLCDSAMLAAGLAERALPPGAEALPALAPGAEAPGDRLAGAVAVIGDSPAALFRLLERLDAGAPRPALILAFPVGFAGAAEAKAALAADPRGVSFVTLRGRKGGPAMAAAALSALAGPPPEG